MAGFRTHVSLSSILGTAYGYGIYRSLEICPSSSFLAACLTAAGGMLPDLDSESGRPVREIFGLAAAVVPVLLLPRLHHAHLSHEAMLTILVVSYMLIRYGAPWLLGLLTVHRGMFHSLPAMLICGSMIYLLYGSPDRQLRILLAIGVMIGFFSHLVLDELYSVDFNGVRLKLKSSAGSALKLFSNSMTGTTICYTILGALLYLAYLDWLSVPEMDRPKLPISFDMPISG